MWLLSDPASSVSARCILSARLSWGGSEGEACDTRRDVMQPSNARDTELLHITKSQQESHTPSDGEETKETERDGASETERLKGGGCVGSDKAATSAALMEFRPHNVCCL